MLKRLTPIFLITAALLLSAASCGKNLIIYDTNQFKFSKATQIYGDKLYYFSLDTIYYKRLDDLSVGALSLCSDPLCMHNSLDCPLSIGMGLSLGISPTMAIDEIETAANNNSPVIYIASNMIEYKPAINDFERGCRIIRYDSLKNKYTVVISNLPEGVNYFCLYKDYIFYTVYDYDLNSQNLFAVTKDGKNKYELDNPDSNSYAIIGADDDAIYYIDMLGNICKSNLELKTKEIIMTRKIPGWLPTYIYDGYLYYTSDIVIIDIGTKSYMNTYTVKRVALGAENDALAETVVENAVFTSQVNNKIYFPKGNPEYYGVGFKIEMDGSQKETDVYSYGCGNLYSFNMDTGETVLEIENEELDMGMFLGGSGNYLVYELYEKHKDLTQPFQGTFKGNYYVFNTVTKKQFEMEEKFN